MTDDDRHERIRQRAYQLWEQEGRLHGREHEYWLRAEAEVADLPDSNGLAGSPGAGAGVCQDCGGTGRFGRKRCKTCGGTGRSVNSSAPEPPQPPRAGPRTRRAKVAGQNAALVAKSG